MTACRRSVDTMLSTSRRPVPGPYPAHGYETLLRRVSAAAQISWSGQDGAIAWAEYSGTYPREAGIAGRRFAALMDRLPLPALWYAVGEAAVEGHHAAGALIEPYLRSRCARIGEELREIQKREENALPERLERGRHGLRSIAAVMAK